VIVETLADVVARGERLPVARPFISDQQDPLIYTSGSTGAPKRCDVSRAASRQLLAAVGRVVRGRRAHDRRRWHHRPGQSFRRVLAIRYDEFAATQACL
jgi:acyl-coenzyme A synthetase/AMP-(fatty) acid ligase